MLTVHHLNQSRSQRVLWALEELQLPYQIVRYQREKSMLAPAALEESPSVGEIAGAGRQRLCAGGVRGHSRVFAGDPGQRRAAEAAGDRGQTAGTASGCTMPKAR